MKKTLALIVLGLLATAALVNAQRDGGGDRGGGDRGGNIGGGNAGNNIGNGNRDNNGNGNRDNNGNGNGNNIAFDNGNSRNVNIDTNGGYFGSDGRYWWHGGYWTGNCYGCGVWICYNCGSTVSCPSCQWYDSSTQQCISTSACTSGRKLLKAQDSLST